jgi:VIT1/CCC1 family predicted Fe2+/Mn2+ transporter
MFMKMGMSPPTALAAADEVHLDDQRAARIHITQELGLDPQSKPSPWIAAMSSFAMFAAGAFVPLIPYALGFTSLVAGLVVGAIGLLVAGGVAARYTRKSWWRSAARQLIFGALAVGATYLVGLLVVILGGNLGA